ncbi:sodium:solute symporter family protein [Streptomyces sp. NBC_01387]|uniref:sodium:solute symporter family protein n=1 Tax=unclassified Streptomyces TaxID=2593676 RepID=UPI0020240990|nr:MULTISPECIES: sodium:solute symporter family protein [unclassified Streptomyces]MCX4550910.1 sodium:solute symporter family protein [Streptomyces sp. NBC_01500]WSC22334.1 sodium:solute symporter family protein [Streptomyces sp. NBC_01766]WSV56176.1 sodium:solute symporter family protein [Streptomyces sp. NBC_01014]
MNATVATSIFAVFMVATVALGLVAVRGGRGGGLAEWSVGGRSLGSVFIWVLMAGEGYTSFSYLGAAGWGYNYGAPVLYVVAYMSCGYALGYVVGPMLWAYARKHGLVGITDMIAHRYGRPWLGAVVAVLATVFLLPYIQLQITGMGVVVSTISYGAISLNWAYFVAFAVTTGFVVVSGLKGSAWVSVLKDALVIGTLAFLACYVPLHYFDGYGPFLDRLVTEKSDWLTFPGHGDSGLGQAWYVTTSLLNSLTVVIFPTTVAGYLGARNAEVLRKNAVWLPAYNLLLFVPMFLGLAALFVVPHLTGAESNLALFKLVTDSLPAWAVGIIGVAAALSSIVPMAIFMLVIGTMWGRSVLSLVPRWRERQKGASQVVVVVAGALALLLTYTAPNTLVRLSLISYEGMAQLLPMLLLGLVWRRLTLLGAGSGLVVGVAVVCAFVFSDHDPVWGVNAGIVALAANLVVALAVTYAGRPDRDPRADAEVLAHDPIDDECLGAEAVG